MASTLFRFALRSASLGKVNTPRPRSVLVLLGLAFSLVGCLPPPPPPLPPPSPPRSSSESLSSEPMGVEADHAAGASNRVAAADPDTPPPPPPAAAGRREIYPHLWLDSAAGHLDVSGNVIAQQFEWLELLACRPGTREHEAIVTLAAQAEHLQLGLLLLGLEPGQPATAQPRDGGVRITPPRGPEVELFFILESEPDRPIPANTWIVDQQTGAELPDNRWLFLGSKIVEHQGRRYFLAEENGTLVSLVNFGDELLGRATDQGESGGNDLWTAHPDRLPPAGTPVTLRIRPAVR